MFQYDFMQRALVAILCVAIVAPILGLLLILRRQTLLADTLSHVSLVGVALGFIWHFSPTIMTLTVVVLAAIAMEYLRGIYKNYSEISVAILMSTGLALALFLMSLKTTNQTAVKIESFLFGSLVTISNEQVVLLIVLAVSVVLLYSLFKRPIYTILFDEDIAYTDGLPVKMMSIGMTVLIGVTISVMMPIAGTLLVASVLILPTAISMRFSKSFTTVIIWGVLISFVGMFSGLFMSYEYSTPPGATITLIYVLIFIVVQCVIWCLKKLLRDKN